MALPRNFFSAQQLLTLNQDQLVLFVMHERPLVGRFRLGVSGLSNLPEGEQEGLKTRLRAAARKARHLKKSLSWAHSRRVISPDISGKKSFEVFCHGELLRFGGRPMLSVEAFYHVAEDKKAWGGLFGPWVDCIAVDGGVLSVFSLQLDDWLSFLQKWQWDNRGHSAPHPGFSAYFSTQTALHTYRRDMHIVENPLFRALIRQRWDCEQRFPEQSGHGSLVDYANAIQMRLRSHGYNFPFTLTTDPREQDPLSTWVEYADHALWWLDRYRAAMKAAALRLHKALEEARRFNAASTETLEARVAAMQRMHIVTQREAILHQFKRRFYLQSAWTKWVLDQLPLIRRPQCLEHQVLENEDDGPSGSSVHHHTLAGQQPRIDDLCASNGSGKRKLADNHDDTMLIRPTKRWTRQETAISNQQRSD